MRLNGKPIDPAARYRITIGSFLATGGDNFTVFKQGTDVTDAGVDLDATEAYLKTNPKVADAWGGSRTSIRLRRRERGTNAAAARRSSELAAVERVALELQQRDGLDPDAQMLADRPLVEGVGLAGQLKLAVERLVRHAQQRPIGHAEAVALRGDGRRFHVDRDRAALVEAAREAV